MQHFYNYIKKHRVAVVRVALMLFLSMFLTFTTEATVRASVYSSALWCFDRFPAFIITSAFLFFVMFLLFSLMRRIDIPFLTVGLVTFGMGAASYFKASYRSEPLYPWDFGIASDAADISSKVSLAPTKSMLISFIAILIVFGVLLFLHIYLKKKGVLKYEKKTKKRKIQLTVQPIVSVIVLIVFFFGIYRNIGLLEAFGIKESAFRQAVATQRNGFLQTFALNTKYISPDKPSSYSDEAVLNAIGGINANEQNGAVKPNIIFVMSESYADISLCENVVYHDDIFKETNELKQNNISGTLFGAQFGGGTCNSEFEVLTGFAMANLPVGCTPYQQYFNNEMISYPKYLKSLGYNTIAIHSYGKQFWNRDVAYPNMGFDKFISEEDFEDPLRRRGLIKDDEVVKMIISEYEANLSSGKPFFNFSVTMQNHGSFEDGQYLKNYRAKLSCDALDPEQEGILTTYATGIRDANIAIGKLIDYFKNVSEPTIICMFGDHLGSLGGNDDIYVKSGLFDGYPEENATNMSQKYTTPFFVWDNYTQQNFVSPRMSFYNLIPSICQWYDLDRPLFFDYLLEQQKIYRGTAMDIYLDTNGNASYEKSDSYSDYSSRHKLFQYDLMFGEKYGLNALYSK